MQDWSLSQAHSQTGSLGSSLLEAGASPGTQEVLGNSSSAGLGRSSCTGVMSSVVWEIH